MMSIAAADELRQELELLRRSKRVALVPTMGCLHEGHLSLIRLARELADLVVVSIYVNPLQFGPSEDYAAYPRPFEADARQCREAGVDLLFHPQNLYPDGNPRVSLHVRELADVLCGARRPGHFDGVATVVNILCNTVAPDVAVFGEKDWQQLAVIRRMASDLAMPTAIIGAPTLREADGLAMSSRNRYLDEEDRRRAPGLYRALSAMRGADAGTPFGKRLDIGRDALREAGIDPEYLEIRDAETLAGASEDRPARAFVAARLGTARLIDNIALGDTAEDRSPS